jgi:hypothetical protein
MAIPTAAVLHDKVIMWVYVKREDNYSFKLHLHSVNKFQNMSQVDKPGQNMSYDTKFLITVVLKMVWMLCIVNQIYRKQYPLSN